MEFKAFINPLLRWWWLVVVATLIAAASSYAAVNQQPQLYQARTTLMIGRTLDNPNPTGNDFFLGQQLATAYADIGRRDAVRENTAASLGLQSLPSYSVRALPNTQIIEITVTDRVPERAQVVANELANQLILLSPTAERPEDQERQQFVEEQLNSLQEKIRETQDDILAKQQELQDLTSAQQISEAQSLIGALESKLNTLTSNYAALLANTQSGAVNTLAVLEYASLPRSPIGPNKTLSVLTAAAIALILAASAAFILEYLDDTVKSPGDLEQICGLPTLAGIARIGSPDDNQKLVTHKQPRTPTSEAFRVLRTGIQLANINNPSRTLLVTSTAPDEGKTTTAANLAVVMAQAGNRVLLIDSDLRRPTLHRLFDLPNRRGLTSLLLELDNPNTKELTDTEHKTAQDTQIEGLQLLSSGPLPPNPSELLGSAKMKKLLGLLIRRYDYVILDSPPVLSVTDAVVLSAQVDGTLLVVKANKTRRGMVRQATTLLRDVNASLVGTVLNALPQNSDGYRNYYHYQRSYHQEDEVNPKVTAPDIPAAIGPLGKLRQWVARRQ